MQLIDEHATRNTQDGAHNIAGVVGCQEDSRRTILLGLCWPGDWSHVGSKGLGLHSTAKYKLLVQSKFYMSCELLSEASSMEYGMTVNLSNTQLQEQLQVKRLTWRCILPEYKHCHAPPKFAHIQESNDQVANGDGCIVKPILVLGLEARMTNILSQSQTPSLWGKARGTHMGGEEAHMGGTLNPKPMLKRRAMCVWVVLYAATEKHGSREAHHRVRK